MELFAPLGINSPIYLLQKKAVRILTNADRLKLTAPLFQQLKNIIAKRIVLLFRKIYETFDH